MRVIRQRLGEAQDNKRRFNAGTGAADSVWAGTVWSGDSMRTAATREANTRWSEFAAAQRTSVVSFGDDPLQLLYRGADPPNTIDRAHATHFVPRPRDWDTVRETGFGRLSQGWNEFPFSHREQILNALQRGEALNPGQIAVLESGLEGYRTSGGVLFSSQHRAMLDMIADLGDPYRHARWHPRGAFDGRLLQLIEMLDHAAAAT